MPHLLFGNRFARHIQEPIQEGSLHHVVWSWGLTYVYYITSLGLLLTFWELLLSSSPGFLDSFIDVPRLQEIAKELLNTCIAQLCLQFAGSRITSFKRETLRGLGFESGIPALAREKQPLQSKGQHMSMPTSALQS